MAYKRTILIQLSGVRVELFRKLLREKALVNINRVFAENGGSYEIISYAGGNHRAVTGAILTGKHPSELNIPVIPEYSYKNRKIEKSSNDLFKVTAANKDVHLYNKFKSPLNIYSLLSLSDSKLGFWDRKIRNWYFAYARKHNHWEMVDRAATKTLLRSLNKGYDLFHITYHALDKSVRIYGNDSERFVYQMDLLDYNIGLILEHLKAKELLDSSLIVLSVSRGYAPVTEKVDLCRLITEINPELKCSHKGASSDSNVIVVQDEKAFAQVYFRETGKKWDKPPQLTLNAGRIVQLAKKLINTPSIDQIMVRTDNNHVKIVAKWGASILRWNRDRIFYDVVSGNDPFNLNNRKSSWSASESYDITRKSRYPDVLWQIRELFSHNDVGQMLINGKRGYSFGTDKKKLSDITTGSLNTDHLTVPVMLSTSNHARIRRPADIYHAIASAMGFESPSPVRNDKRLRKGRDGGKRNGYKYGNRRPGGRYEHKKNRG